MTEAELRLLADAAIIGDNNQPVNLVDTQSPSHGLCGGQSVARRHDDPQAAGLERSQRFGRAGLDRIGDGEQSCKVAEIEQRLADMASMRLTLHWPVSACEAGDRTLPCPIVEALSGTPGVPSL